MGSLSPKLKTVMKSYLLYFLTGGLFTVLIVALEENGSRRDRVASPASARRSRLSGFCGFFRCACCPGGGPLGRASHSPDDRSSRLPGPAPEWLWSVL